MGYTRRLFPFILILVLLTLALLLVLSPLRGALCSTRRVYGIVRDELSGEPVADATILTDSYVAHSDQAGHYYLGWIKGALTLTVSADGYLPMDVAVPRVRVPGQSAPLSLALTPNTLTGIVRDAETGSPLPGSVIVVDALSTSADMGGQYTLRRVKMGALLHASAAGHEMSNGVFSGQQVHDFVLKPAETPILVADLYSQQPLSNSLVSYGSLQFTTDENGTVTIKRLVKGAVLSVQAVGHIPTQYMYDGIGKALITLRPNTLQGVIKDSSKELGIGKGQPVQGATVAVISGGNVITYSITGADGRYAFWDLPHPIMLVVVAVGYDRATVKVGAVTELDVYLEPLQVKGIYMPLGILTNEKRVRELIDLVHRTELNTIVVDVKNDRGWLAYDSPLTEAQQSEAYKPQVMDIHKFISLCQQQGIYTIARLVLFKDSTLAAAYPEWAVQTADGKLWKDAAGSAWSDPFRREVQDYNIAIAKEVAMLGFDELQFDYVRFPSDGDISEVRYAQESTLESRSKVINEFCMRLRTELQPYAVLLSADLFGMTAWVEPGEDMGIGQRVIDIAPYMDYLSPMLYPATFSRGSIEYDEPLLYPYEVVYRSCLELIRRTPTRVRPWLQHYSWNDVTYGAKELRLQKKAAADAKTYGWMFWNAAGVYNEEAFDPAPIPWMP